MHRNGNYRRTFAGLRLALAKWVDDAHSPVNDEAILHVFRPQDTAAGAKRRDNHARIVDHQAIMRCNPQRLACASMSMGRMARQRVRIAASASRTSAHGAPSSVHSGSGGSSRTLESCRNRGSASKPYQPQRAADFLRSRRYGPTICRPPLPVAKGADNADMLPHTGAGVPIGHLRGFDPNDLASGGGRC